MQNGNSDSTLAAAKKTASALQISWTEMQPIYRELQTQDGNSTAWLPKSAGRKIFTAHPNYVTRLLVALGFKSPKVTAHTANYISRGLTPEGRDLWASEWPAAGNLGVVEAEFERFLINPEVADNVAQIHFDAAEKSIIISYKDGSSDLRLLPAKGGFWRDDMDLFRDTVRKCLGADTSARVSSIVVIDGAAISEIANTVSWRNSPSPVRIGGEGEDEE